MKDDQMEQQVDWLIFEALPKLSLLVCAAAGLYFGGHILVAFLKGWL